MKSKNIMEDKTEVKRVRPRPKRSRYRVIRLSDFFIVYDCLEEKVWHPFSKAWEANKMIERIKKENNDPTAKKEDFSKNTCYRAIIEAGIEFNGKCHILKKTLIDKKRIMI